MRKLLISFAFLFLICQTAFAAPFTVNGSATTINVTAGTGTLAQLYADLYAYAGDAETYMARTGADPYVYAVVGNRVTRVYSGVTINMTNAGDEWRLNPTANQGANLTFDAGSTFNVVGDCIINLANVDPSKYNYFYGKGNMNLIGTAGHNVIIKNYYRGCRFTSAGNTVVFDYVDFQTPGTYSTSNYAIYFDASYETPTGWSFTNITLSNRTNSGYLAYMPSNGMNYSGITFDSWDSTDTRYGFSSIGALFKVTNSAFRNISYYNTIYGGGGLPFYLSQYDSSYNANAIQQPKVTFENCTFQDNYDASSTEYGFYLAYGSVVKFKNCSFVGVDDQLSQGMYATYQARFLLVGGVAGQTWTNVGTNLTFSSTTNTGYYEVYELDLTVTAGGSPLAGATVTVRQHEGNETHTFITDSNGQIKDLFGDLPVFVYREILSNTPTYDVWSDGSGNLYHDITVSHPDYQIDTRQVAFSQDRVITAQLSDLQPDQTTIYGSTIYDSTIY